MDTHGKIMNIAINEKMVRDDYDSGEAFIAYKEGHRDARHQAAEIAQESEQVLKQQIKHNEQLIEKLADALQDARGTFDTPIARRRMKGDGVDDVRKEMEHAVVAYKQWKDSV